MANTINPNNAGLRVKIDSSRTRQTPKTNFGSVFKTGLSKTADTVMGAGNMAAPYIPGGAILSAAITGLGGLKSKSSAYSASSPNAVSVGGGGGGGTGGVSSSGGSSNFSNMEELAAQGDSGAMQLLATKEMQEMNQSFNLQYLELQQNMQQENRKFSTLSNIMKTKHDTAKATINNVR
ncbi:MAG: hypothetical protein VX699_09530 [Myxococcota bacterium]|nr:hypothetical protein [Myxococcota bacterium]